MPDCRGSISSAIANTPRERFDLVSVVASCFDAYRSIYPGARFSSVLPQTELPVLGSPDLIAQMLDKLIANAVDFARTGSAIEMLLEANGRRANLYIANEGPLLPEGMGSQLFESMVSVRPEGGTAPHLGLGLYIVRLIVEFHEGSVQLVDRSDGKGVLVTVSLPLAL